MTVDDAIFDQAVVLHRPFMEDGVTYCEIDDECYPCEAVVLAVVALRLGRLVELLERQR